MTEDENKRSPAHNLYDIIDNWTNSYGICKSPPIAYCYRWEGCFAWDRDDFAAPMPPRCSMGPCRSVDCQTAEAYGQGLLKPEDFDW